MPPLTTMKRTSTERRDPIVLDYRARGSERRRWIGPLEVLKAALAFAVMSWATFGFVYAGATAKLAWVPVSLAAAGLTTGVLAATKQLAPDNTGGARLAIFMSFTVLALWLLALALL
jgi:hypothetical protein